MIVNQWVPAAHKGDAIGDSARRVRGLLRELGHESEIYAMTMDDDLRGDVREWTDPAARRGDLTIFHFALVSPMTAEFARLPRGRVLQYHNVTPAHFFAPYDTNVFRLARAEPRRPARRWSATPTSRWATRSTTGRSSRTWASRTPASFRLPSTRARSPMRRGVPTLEAILTDGLSNFLFVGRIAPNKKIEDHIRLAEFYKRYVDIAYRFIFVGKTDGMPRYYNMIRQLIHEFEMPRDRFIFTGAGTGRRPGHLLPDRRRLRLAVGARRLLRAAARSHVGRRAGDGLLPRPPCPTRSAAPACSLRRKTSNTPPSSWASSPTTTRSGPR